MIFLPLAPPLSCTFTKGGAIAAIAALLGIAVLSLLVFAQGRELKRLREWAGRAPERDAEVEQRVAAAAAARMQQQPAAVPGARPVPPPAPIPNRAAAAATAGPATRIVGGPVPAAPAAGAPAVGQ